MEAEAEIHFDSWRKMKARAEKAEAAYRKGLAGHPEGCVCADHATIRNLKAEVERLRAARNAYASKLDEIMGHEAFMSFEDSVSTVVDDTLDSIVLNVLSGVVLRETPARPAAPPVKPKSTVVCPACGKHGSLSRGRFPRHAGLSTNDQTAPFCEASGKTLAQMTAKYPPAPAKKEEEK